MNMFFVFLRRPKGDSDYRDDPFWEFGSFGRTGCHSTNLLNPQRSHIQAGDVAVFLQGGEQEIRVVGRTPPLKLIRNERRVELTWNREYRPVPYRAAPILINNDGYSDFPSFDRLLQGVHRSTFCGQAASKLRSRTEPIPDDIAAKLEEYFSHKSRPQIASYLEAIPFGSWRSNAEKQRWADASLRADRFHKHELIDQSNKPANCRYRVRPKSRDC